MARETNITETSRLLADDYRKVFGNHLISVTLYGSAVTDEYIPKKSDLNFLVVLSEEGIEQLHFVYELVAKWRKKRVGTPLFLTKAYINSSLDTFPVEFLNIKRNYTVVFGKISLRGFLLKRSLSACNAKESSKVSCSSLERGTWKQGVNQ